MVDTHNDEENPTPLRILDSGGASSSMVAPVDHPISEGGPQAEETSAAQEQREESANGYEGEESASHSSSSDPDSEIEEEMAAGRTLKELAAPDFNHQPLCIQYPTLDVAFELKSGLIHLLPTFHGRAGEDPNKHLMEFHVVCSSMKSTGVTEEQIKLRAFPFSLGDDVKDWLYYLLSGTVTTWNEMKRMFLERYFPASRAATIRKEICGIRQYNGETLYEYLERFKKLCASCPHHQISDQLLIQYLYEGLLPMERNMIDAASGGALVDKTTEAAKQLISNMAANFQQFGTRHDAPTKKVNEVSTSSIEQQLFDLTSLVRQLAVGNAQQVKACGICSTMGHQMDMCPTLQEEGTEQVNTVENFSGPPRQHDPYSNTYNLGWRDHPNFSYGGNRQVGGGQNFFQNRQQQQQGFQPKQPASQSSNSSLEDIVKSLALNTKQFQQDTRSSIQSLENQMGQMATAISRLEAQVGGKLPSQIVVNPKENVNAVTLRSGKKVEEPKLNIPSVEKEAEIKDEIEKEKATTKSKVIPNPSIQLQSNTLPFPSRFAKSKKEEKDKEILEMFRKVEVNIPLLDAIKQVPRYAKFLKELCTNKWKLNGDEKIIMGENVSAVFQRKLPPKCKDPGMFTIPCKIGNTRIERAMVDLGASINVMPRSIYVSLNLGPVKDTGVIIQLADRTNAYPEGVVEDVLVQVNELVFPTDFYILDMDDSSSPDPAPILLGRPFLNTARTKIDVHDGTLTMEFNGEVIRFNIYDVMESG
ncbi:uncharacterized protein LOC116128914 [Pistacia vera]|uniref:uncharacterized protein LOC116128914 n=1 Tax=Pistacia vera TaxID=55513 RepID=UPI001262D73B|nr:uncharacterized protein LOC116128914 [Pistacia vera]